MQRLAGSVRRLARVMDRRGRVRTFHPLGTRTETRGATDLAPGRTSSMAKCLTIVNDAGRLEVENELRRQICKAGRRMYGSGFIVACEGNLSVRLDPDRILVTPTGVCKGHLAPQDLLVTDPNGNVKC